MATSHSGWGNCPAHKKNQLAMYPGVWYIRTSVLSVISVVGMWHVAVGGMGCGPRPCCPGSYSWPAPWMSCRRLHCQLPRRRLRRGLVAVLGEARATREVGWLTGPVGVARPLAHEGAE